MSHRGELRAAVSLEGQPVTSGRVLFSANGIDLGRATLDPSGLASMMWIPAATQLAKLPLTTQRPPALHHVGEWNGGLQAWYEPATVGDPLPGVLSGPPDGAPACTWAYSDETDPPATALRRAHDACQREATSRPITTWNHSTTIDYPRRMLAVFRFEDPHLAAGHLTNGYQSVVREVELQVRTHVTCTM